MVPWDLLCFVSLNSGCQWQPISSSLMYILCSCWRVSRNHFRSWNSHHCQRGETLIWRMSLSLHIFSTSIIMVILHCPHSAPYSHPCSYPEFWVQSCQLIFYWLMYRHQESCITISRRVALEKYTEDILSEPHNLTHRVHKGKAELFCCLEAVDNRCPGGLQQLCRQQS